MSPPAPIFAILKSNKIATIIMKNLCFLLILLPYLVNAQWTNRYPKVQGFGHHVYFEGFEMPIMTSGPTDPTCSPDGQQIAFAAKGWIWTMDLKSRIATQLTSSGGMDSRPDYAPDGQSIVFVRDDSKDTDIVLWDLKSGEEQIIVDEPAVDLDPAFSSDGKFVFYSSAVNGNLDIWKIELSTGKKERIIASMHQERKPQPYPNSNEMLYLNKKRWGYADAIEYVNLGAASPQTYALESYWIASQANFDLGVDGQTVAYTWPHGDGYELRLKSMIGPNTSILLTQSKGMPLSPALSPDLKYVYFSEANSEETTELKRISTTGGPIETLSIKSWNFKNPVGQVIIQTKIKDKPENIAARLNIVDQDNHPLFPDQGAVRSEGQNGRIFFYSSGLIALTVPAGKISISAVQGIVTPETKIEVEVKPGLSTTIVLELDPLWDAKANGWYSGDHHFHLNYGGPLILDPEDLFLEMEGEDLDVAIPLLANLHNRFLQQELWNWEKDQNGRILRFGQEIRSHFLGHMELIGTEELFWPWIWGPGYQVYGADDRPNMEALEFAHKHKGLGGYVHPVSVQKPFAPGLSSGIPRAFIADAVLGYVDLLEVACLWSDELGTSRLWHRLLNLGIPIAASAGTDIMSDYYRTMAMGTTRVYVRMEEGKPFTFENYLERFRAGHSFVTNGPVLDFRVEGQQAGQVVNKGGQKVTWTLDLASALPVQSLELLVNGEVVWSGQGLSEAGKKQYSGEVELPDGGWIAMMANGGTVSWPLMDSYPFAHTSPIWINEVGSTEPAAEKKAASELLRVLNEKEKLIEMGYQDNPIPKIKAHFQKARELLEQKSN